MRRHPGHGHAVHHEARAQERPVEGLAVVADDRRRLLAAPGEVAKHRRLGAGARKEELAHAERLVLEEGHAEEERQRAGAAAQARGLGVDEEELLRIDVREARVEGEARDERGVDREGAPHRDAAVMMGWLEVLLDDVERTVRGLVRLTGQLVERRRLAVGELEEAALLPRGDAIHHLLETRDARAPLARCARRSRAWARGGACHQRMHSRQGRPALRSRSDSRSESPRALRLRTPQPSRGGRACRRASSVRSPSRRWRRGRRGRGLFARPVSSAQVLLGWCRCRLRARCMRGSPLRTRSSRRGAACGAAASPARPEEPRREADAAGDVVVEEDRRVEAGPLAGRLVGRAALVACDRRGCAPRSRGSIISPTDATVCIAFARPRSASHHRGPRHAEASAPAPRGRSARSSSCASASPAGARRRSRRSRGCGT